MSADEVEVTSNDSPEQWKEFIAGLKDGGDISFDMIYLIDDATQSGQGDNSFSSIFDAQRNRHWAIRIPTTQVGDVTQTVGGTSVTIADSNINVFTNNSFFIFDGFVKEMGQSIQMSDVIMRNCALRVSGKVTFPRAVTRS